MTEQPARLTDPRAIKAISHPARFRVIEELYGGATLTATEAGELCGLSGSAMSYHMRLLERYGLIAADPSEDGRERRWRKARPSLEFGALRRTPENSETADAVFGNALESIRRMLATSTDSDPASAYGATTYVHGRLRLSDDEAKELDRRVNALIDEFEGHEEPAGPDAPPVRELFWLRGTPRAHGSAPPPRR